MIKKAQRPTLEQACSRYVHRYTMEHVPQWAKKPHYHTEMGKHVYYAPQYRSDSEWYANTIFPEDRTGLTVGDACHSSNQTWPLGQWLDAPYSR